MGVKMGWIQIKMGHPLAQNGAALAPFRANGAHPSIYYPLQVPCQLGVVGVVKTDQPDHVQVISDWPVSLVNCHLAT